MSSSFYTIAASSNAIPSLANRATMLQTLSAYASRDSPSAMRSRSSPPRREDSRAALTRSALTKRVFRLAHTSAAVFVIEIYIKISSESTSNSCTFAALSFLASAVASPAGDTASHRPRGWPAP